MDSDLEDYHKKNKLLQTDISNLQMKQSSLQNEILFQRKKLADSNSLSKRIKHDLHQVMDVAQNAKQFKKSFLDLHGKYSATRSSSVSGSAANTDDNEDGEEAFIAEEYLLYVKMKAKKRKKK